MKGPNDAAFVIVFSVQVYHIAATPLSALLGVESSALELGGEDSTLTLGGYIFP